MYISIKKFRHCVLHEASEALLVSSLLAISERTRMPVRLPASADILFLAVRNSDVRKRKGAEQRRPKMESRELSARTPPRARPPARAAHYSVCLDRLPLFLIRRVHYQADVAHLNGQVRTAVKRRVGCRDLDGRSL
jgi:hypothetical protein